MICPKCGIENRPGARFCKYCGAVMEQPAAPPPSPVPPSPAYVPQPPPSEPLPAEAGPAGGARVIGGIGMFGGIILAVLGALGAGGAFFLPWFSYDDASYSGLFAVQQALVGESGDITYLVWGLVPLGALGLLGLGIVCLAVSLFSKKLSPGLARAVSLLPLLLVLSGLCGCGPLTTALLSPLWNAEAGSFNDVLAGMGYGFWGALAGLGVAVVGAIIALVGGMVSRRRAAS